MKQNAYQGIVERELRLRLEQVERALNLTPPVVDHTGPVEEQ